MGGRRKEPVKLIVAKGKKHLSKKEIEERENTEIKVNYTNISIPEYLEKKEKDEFKRISEILLDIGIMTELDEDCLAQYLISKSSYLKYTKEIRKLEKSISKEKSIPKKNIILNQIDTYLKYQNRALKQCRACASDLGLSISSRCKLVLPEPKEPPKENKFSKFKVTNK